MSEAILVADALAEWCGVGGYLWLEDRASTARTYSSMLQPLRALGVADAARMDGIATPSTHGGRAAPFYLHELTPALERESGDPHVEDRRPSATTDAPTCYREASSFYLHELTPAICRELAAGRLRAGMAPNTLRSFVAILSRFGAWCVERGYCSNNFAAGVPRPPHRKVQRRYLSREQAVRVWEAASDDYDRLALLLMAGSGLRRAEVVSLRVRDCDFETGVIRIYGKGSKWRLCAPGVRAMGMMNSTARSSTAVAAAQVQPGTPHAALPSSDISDCRMESSSPKHRLLPQGDAGHRASRNEDNDQPTRVSRASVNPTTDRIMPFGAEALYRRVQSMGRKAGVPRLHPHMLRHLFAAQFWRESGDAAALQTLLGHSLASTTAIYIEDGRAETALQRQRDVGLADRLFGD